MPFLSTRDLPNADAYGALLEPTFPRAVERRANILGPGYLVEVPILGVTVGIEITHVQGTKRPVAHTSVAAYVPTRGLDIELSSARSLPAYMEPKALPHPGLASLARVAAPDAVVDKVLLPEVLDALAQHISAHGAPGELIVSEGKVELSYSGWPSDQRTLQSIAWIVGRVASLVPAAIDSVAGPGGTLDGHPEVLALRERRAKRRRIGLTLLAVVGGFVLLVALAICVGALAMARR